MGPMNKTQNQTKENAESTSDFFGATGPVNFPNTSVGSHMINNPTPNATQTILSTFQMHHHQQLPTNINLPPSLYNNNNSYFPQSSPQQHQILSHDNNGAGMNSSSIISRRKETETQKTTDKLTDVSTQRNEYAEGSSKNTPSENKCSQSQANGKFIQSNIKEKTKLIANDFSKSTSTQ